MINLKNLNKFTSYEHFNRAGQFAMKMDSKGRYFSSSPQQKLIKVCEISMVRQPIRISLPSLNFYKIFKCFNRILERVYGKTTYNSH